jgi:hypothetical protein
VTGKKKPDVFTPGWEALLLSHIKAPAQGGKAGSGKPPDQNLTKTQQGFKQSGRFLSHIQGKNLSLFSYWSAWLSDNRRTARHPDAHQAQFSAYDALHPLFCHVPGRQAAPAAPRHLHPKPGEGACVDGT